MKLIQLLLEYDKDKTISTYGKKIELANQQDRQKLSAEQIITKFEEVDPSMNKQFVQWICKQYISGALKIEDLYKVTNPLIIFQKFKKRLPQEKRDINKMSIFDLYDIEDQISNPQLETNDSQEEFGTDVKVWYNGPLGYLITPLTKEAAIRYGKGTKWCTSNTEKENMFDLYTNTGHLFIWRDKNGDRYQFHLQKEEYKDIKDRELDYNEKMALSKHPVLQKILTSNGSIAKQEREYINQRAKIVTKEAVEKGGDIDSLIGIVFARKAELEQILNQYCSENDINKTDFVNGQYDGIIHEIINELGDPLFELYALLINYPYDFSDCISQLNIILTNIRNLNSFPLLRYTLIEILNISIDNE